jgi:hypothetical protein
LKIIGGHDYYDVALSMGIDPRIVLLRGKSKSIPVKAAGGSLLDRYLELKPQVTYNTYGIGIENVAVAFCGKVYRGAVGLKSLEKPEGLWSADKARAFVAQEKNRKIDVDSRWYDRRNRMTMEEYFTPFDAPDALRNYMIANKISILVEEPPKYRGEESYFQVNPFTLKQLGFAKALDPYTAFQELSMWIGGVLGGTSPEIVTIKDDKVLIENHGFDNRFSFRGPRIA